MIPTRATLSFYGCFKLALSSARWVVSTMWRWYVFSKDNATSLESTGICQLHHKMEASGRKQTNQSLPRIENTFALLYFRLPPPPPPRTRTHARTHTSVITTVKARTVKLSGGCCCLYIWCMGFITFDLCRLVKASFCVCRSVKRGRHP